MKCRLRFGAMSMAVSLGALYGAGEPEPAGIPAAGDHAEALFVLPARAPKTAELNQKRILKVIPDYQTVRESSGLVAPLSAREKWHLGLKEAVDPFNVGNALLTAAFAQRGNQTPSYGEGWDNYGRRVGAAVGDFGTQSLLSAGVFASLLHQDPRYFRKGEGSGVLSRVAYSLSRLVICRGDSGRGQFNASNFLGMSVGIAASNAYYPSASRTGSVMAARVETSLFGGVTGNLLSEFWPDIQRKFFHRKRR